MTDDERLSALRSLLEHSHDHGGNPIPHPGWQLVSEYMQRQIAAREGVLIESATGEDVQVSRAARNALLDAVGFANRELESLKAKGQAAN